MKGLKRFVLSLSVIAVIFIVGIGIGSRTANADEDTVTEAVIIENESGEEDVVTLEDVDCKLSSVAELATYEQTYQVTLTDEDSKKVFGISIPFWTVSTDVSYSGTVKVGYDIDEIGRAVDNEAKVITITLPQAKVLSNELDEDSQEISREMVDSEQLKDYRVVIKEAGLQEAEEAGIYELAEEHMEEILIDLFSEFEGYEVIFT